MTKDAKSHPWIRLLSIVVELGFAVILGKIYRSLTTMWIESVPEIQLGDWNLQTKWIVFLGALVFILLIIMGGLIIDNWFSHKT